MSAENNLLILQQEETKWLKIWGGTFFLNLILISVNQYFAVPTLISFALFFNSHKKNEKYENIIARQNRQTVVENFEKE